MAKCLKNTESKRLVDWTVLPSDILDTILDNLFRVSDYVRFGAVCKSWNSVAVNYQRIAAAVHEKPPLLLFLNPCDYNFETCSFKLSSLINLFSIGEERLCKSGFEFDQWTSKHDVICLGSSYGWLAMQTSTSSIILLNPFIRNLIEIPSIPTSFGTISKIIFSCDPSTNRDELVIAALTSTGEIALITLGQQHWTRIDHEHRINSKGDMVFYKGFLYVIYKDRVDVGFSSGYKNLMAIDYKHPQTYDRHGPHSQHRVFDVKKMSHVDSMPFWDDYKWRCFLVEASNGDLLLVELSFRGNHVPNFKASKVMKEDEHHWRRTEMGNIDDVVLVSDNSCLCIPAAGSGSNPNSIYFFLSCYDKRYNGYHLLDHEEGQTGIFNLSNGTLSELRGYPRVPKGVLPPMPIALLSP